MATDEELLAAIKTNATGPRTKLYEEKACARCGHVRRVLIRKWRTVGRNGEIAEETSWSHLCTACHYENRAAVYTDAAKKMKAKAYEARVKQRAHKQSE